MAASHALIFLKDFTISSTATGLFDTSGNSVASADLTSDTYYFTKTVELSPKSIEHILVAACEGCTMEVWLEMSPDGENWIGCKLADGTTDCKVNCTSTAGDCSTQVIDSSLLEYVRLKIGKAGSTGGTCTLQLNFTLN